MDAKKMLIDLLRGNLTKTDLKLMLRPLVLGFQENQTKVVWKDPEDNRSQAGTTTEFFSLEREIG